MQNIEQINVCAARTARTLCLGRLWLSTISGTILGGKQYKKIQSQVSECRYSNRVYKARGKRRI